LRSVHPVVSLGVDNGAGFEQGDFMHHRMRLAALPLLLVLGAARGAPDPAISYELAPEMQGDTIAALQVTIRLRADKSGTTT
ncbi:hypothetical protein, partial [Enterobacter asburiae]|uniref:hypothetical protein n=1 Tax=Enterobacter asburiae TaxID=61645 RepID=UPI0013D524E2